MCMPPETQKCCLTQFFFPIAALTTATDGNTENPKPGIREGLPECLLNGTNQPDLIHDTLFRSASTTWGRTDKRSSDPEPTRKCP